MRSLPLGLAVALSATEIAAEDASGQLVMGIAHSSRYGTLAELSFEADNLGQYDIDARARYRASEEGDALSFDVGKFWRLGETVLGSDTRVRIGVQGLGANWEADRYALRQLGLTFGASAAFAADARYSVQAFWREDELIDFEAGVSTVLTADEGSSAIAGLTFGVDWDTRANKAILGTGHAVSGTLSFSGLGDTRKVSALSLSAQTTMPLVNSAVLKVSTQAGTAMANGSSDALHALDRSYTAGGMPRGFAYGGAGPVDSATGDFLGGANYAGASIEAVLPVGSNGLALGLFYDVGSVWDLPGVSSPTVDDSQFFRSSAGLSVNWDTPAGTLRASFAEAIDKRPTDDTQVFSLSFNARF